jgi:hypothetical protein
MSFLLSGSHCCADSGCHRPGIVRAFELPRDRQKQERDDHGRPDEEPGQVGGDSRPTEVEEAALGVDRSRSDPEVAEEAPDGASTGVV